MNKGRKARTRSRSVGNAKYEEENLNSKRSHGVRDPNAELFKKGKAVLSDGGTSQKGFMALIMRENKLRDRRRRLELLLRGEEWRKRMSEEKELFFERGGEYDVLLCLRLSANRRGHRREQRRER